MCVDWQKNQIQIQKALLTWTKVCCCQSILQKIKDSFIDNNKTHLLNNAASKLGFADRHMRTKLAWFCRGEQNPFTGPSKDY